MLTVLLGLSASLSYSLHDFIMVGVSKLARPLTCMFWVFSSSLAIMLPIALIVDGLPHARIGEVTAAGRLEIHHETVPVISADIAALKESWQKPLRW